MFIACMGWAWLTVFLRSGPGVTVAWIWVVNARKINISVERSVPLSCCRCLWCCMLLLHFGFSPCFLTLAYGLQLAQPCCIGPQGCYILHLHRIKYFTQHLGVQTQRKQICLSGQLSISIRCLSIWESRQSPSAFCVGLCHYLVPLSSQGNSLGPSQHDTCGEPESPANINPNMHSSLELPFLLSWI